MRALVFCVLVLISVSAMANPFDSFIGHYKIVGTPQVKNSDSVQCRRFNLAEAKSLQVVSSEDRRSGRTHLIKISKVGGGAATFSIDEFNYDSGFSEPEVRHYQGSTDGRAPNFALNSQLIYNNSESNMTQISLGRPGGRIELRISEQHEENSDFGYRRWSCEFIAKFR